ncbi:hypothetical protein AXF42_Ash013089 [Apostasia shenzhenica]|uniref:Uncharacterized protein n=1 Tax=Apostasia shenzhenica TaxID=1088818 RepID=A0A2I0BD18_9ASPA|nr:hypothetical protein AXF42_Ash013089 [Apostasia shenzhenica]
MAPEMGYVVKELIGIHNDMKWNLLELDGTQIQMTCLLGLCEGKSHAVLERVRVVGGKDQPAPSEVIASELRKEMVVIVEHTVWEIV